MRTLLHFSLLALPIHLSALQKAVPLPQSVSLSQAAEAESPSVQEASEDVNKRKLKTDSLGTKLAIQANCLDPDEGHQAKTSILTSGQMLVGTCDVLFSLDANKNVIWEHHVPAVLCDFVFIPSTGLIYATAGDNNMLILEASSGAVLVHESRNGAAAYGQVKAYGHDMCLVTDYNAGYRERHDDPSEKDGVTLWRGTERLWSAELPPGADLIVKGTRILALTKTKEGIFIKNIAVPKVKPH